MAWGRSHWEGARDLSFRFQAVVGDRLELRVEVIDDVVALEATRAIDRDHLEVGLPGSENTRLGLILQSDSLVATRRWERTDPKQRFVDEPFEAQGHWTRTATGYLVRWSIDVARLGPRKGPGAAFELRVSDADGRGQESLLGVSGGLGLWSEYPPTFEEWRKSVPEW